MSTRWLPIAVLLSVAALVLAGCGAGDTASDGDAKTLSKPAAQAPLKGDVKVWSWDVAATALKRLAPAFEAKHPGVKIDVVDIGYDNAYDKLSVGLRSGSGLPDVMTVETDRMPTYIEQFPKGFVDLAPRAKAHKADFDPSKWAASSDAAGHLFSLPWDSGTMGVFYRRDVIEEAGVDPQSIGTWDEFLRAGEQIKAKTGKKLFAMDITGGDSIFGTMLQEQGQSYFDADGRIALTTPAAVRALTVLKEMNAKGLIANEKGWDGLVTANKEGKVATAPIAVWWAGTMTSEMKDLSGKIGVMPLPDFSADGPHTSSNGGSTLAIPAQSKNPDAAWAFVSFVLADAGNQASMMEHEGLFPSFLPALATSYFSKPQPYFGGQPIYEFFREATERIPAVDYTSDHSQAYDIARDAVAGSLLDGKDPQEALASAAKQLKSATQREIGS